MSKSKKSRKLLKLRRKMVRLVARLSRRPSNYYYQTELAELSLEISKHKSDIKYIFNMYPMTSSYQIDVINEVSYYFFLGISPVGFKNVNKFARIYHGIRGICSRKLDNDLNYSLYLIKNLLKYEY